MFFILNGGRFSGVEVDESNTVDNHIVPFKIQHTLGMSGFNDFFLGSDLLYQQSSEGAVLYWQCEPLHRIQRVVSLPEGESRVIHRRTTLANKSQSTNWHEISFNKHIQLAIGL